MITKSPDNGEIIIIEDQEFLHNQRIAGSVVSRLLKLLESETKSGNCATGLDLDDLAEEFILDHKCQPTFKNYKHTYPNSICVSVNNVAVHGVPNIISFKEGDIISIDLGATYNRAIADSAVTFILGKPNSQREENLVTLTKLALTKAIESIKIESRLGIIGETINNVAKNNNLSVIVDYGGHGIARDTAHAKPFVSNKDSKSNGIRIQNGMSLAIEPIFTLALTSDTKTANDGWSVNCMDKTAHFEHTININNNIVEIIT